MLNFKSKFFPISLFLIFFCAVISVFYFYNFYWGAISSIDEPTPEKYGVLGDYFGGVLNPIFSFFSFFALLITIYLQSHELNLSTKELKRSAEALQEQGKALDKQNFENTFFKMVELNNNIVNDIDIKDTHNDKESYEGRDCFKFLYKEKLLKGLGGKQSDTDRSESIEGAYDIFLKSYSDEILHYFNNFLNIIKFVDDGIKENKVFYLDIVKAQLSTYEILMLFYHGLHSRNIVLKEYMEEYKFFEYLNHSLLQNPKEDLLLYDFRVYGESQLITEYLHSKKLHIKKTG